MRSRLILLPFLASCATASRASFAVWHSSRGCTVEEIATVPGEHHFSFRGISPDGKRIAIGLDAPQSRKASYLLDLGSGRRTDVLALNNGGSFSPDGRFLVAAVYVSERNTEIIEYDMATGRADTIAPHATADFLPSYSPDGRAIVFNSYRTGRSDLYLYDRATKGLRQLTTFDGYDAHAQFSPDGRQIVFHRQTGPRNYELVLLDVAGATERVLTSAIGEEAYPAFSPTGSHVVYSDDRDHPGMASLYVVAINDPSTVRPLLDDGFGATYAAWSADGRYVYFVSRRAGTAGVYRLAMNGVDCKH